MAEPMENGPSSCNGEAEQVWERPWTLDEMRKNSVNWSLAADSGLFLYLQDFSQRMVSKTHEIEKQLDGLIRDTKATDSCLHTVFNDFLMLSNIQFIENRVYDEEVEEPGPKTETQERRPEQEKTREQKEAELIPKIQEAVNYGLKVLESAFEQLDVKVGNSDSEDEEAADRVEPILEPKDLYVDRPLPYLIGSQAFMEQDDIGLGDLSSDEMSIDSDRESFVESEVDKDQDEHSDDDFDQEGESREKFKKKPLSSDEDEENEDSDLFGESDKDEDEARRDDVGPASFADQLAARIKDTTKKPETDRTSLSSGTSATKKKHQGKKLPQAQVEDDDEMFKPTKMEDEEYSPFGEKGGLFSGGKGLFDDDEGDLFSEAPKKEKEQAVSQKSDGVNTKKIPTGAVSIFPENSLFGSPNGSGSLESNENDRLVKSKVHAALDQPSLGGGLFDDEEDDDFFSGKTLKKPAAQKKAKPKMTADLFGGDEDDDDEDGDIFNVGSHPAASKQSKKFAEEEEVQPQEKKLPAGAISIFGPGTNSLLAESLRKRHPSTSEESVKSEESMPPPVVKPPVAPKTTEKARSKSLFSDDEDSQIFPTMPKSQSKPEGPAQKKPSKAKVSIFDDDEEEDLFSSVPKSQSVQVKTAVPQPKKALSSSLFSDDEEQWMSSQPSPAKPDGKSGGMKASTSAPSRLPSANASQTDSLFNDDDDLFAATKEPSQKKPQRVSLLFEDEDDEDKGSLFGIKQSVSKGTPEAKVPAASQAPTLFGPEETQKEAKEKPSEKKAMQTASSPEETNKSKKPAGAVSLFGGINVLGEEAKTTTKQSRNALEDIDDLDWHKEAPPPMETKEKKATKNTFSLFDDDDEDDDEPDEIPPISTATKHSDKSTLKEPRNVVKSTGVFQDEELLFSQTQQRDNDPEVDLFATSTKPSTTVSSSVKPAVSALFGEEEDDDLFSSAKPKAPPKVPNKPSKAKHEETDKGSISVQSVKSEKPVSPVSPVKPKETSSRIGKRQASLAINPANLMPGASPRTPGAVSIMPDLAQSSSPGFAGLPPESAATAGSRVAAEGGIGFDTPAQVTTLQNANKDRVKGATQRRPQTRAARHLAAQRSEESRLGSLAENPALQAGSGARTTSLPSAFNPIPARPSALTLPITTSTTTVPVQTVSDGVVRPKVLPPAEEDLFSSEDLFASASAPKHTPPSQTKAKPPETVFHGPSKKKEPTQPIFNDHSEDLFVTVKPKTVKKAKAMPFLDDDDDIFATETKKTSKSLASSIKPDIFQDVDETPSKVLKKPKEQSQEASLFDDDVDIFADLTPVTKPKEKKAKKKAETKSIFDDDMDDIFSSGITKPVGASTANKSKKPVLELNSAEESGHNIFDDPLNVFGGK